MVKEKNTFSFIFFPGTARRRGLVVVVVSGMALGGSRGTLKAK